MFVRTSRDHGHDETGAWLFALFGAATVTLALAGCGQEATRTSGATKQRPQAASSDTRSQGSPSGTAALQDTPSTAQANPSDGASHTTSAGIPRLLDLGAGKCIPCKKMAPILEELKKEYAGAMEVVFIDVWQNPRVALQYGIEAIPTQIFFDASGRELFRHEGFYSKEEILAKWKELGVSLSKPTESAGR